MKKASDVLGLRVMGIKEGQEKGIAQDFMIDPFRKKVEYVILKDNGGYGFRAIRTTDIVGIGADYIMTASVANVQKLYESKETLEEIEDGFFLLGTTALSSSGDIVGSVADFSFEEKTGEIGALILDNGQEYAGSKIAALAGKMVFVDPDGVDMAKQRDVLREQPAEPEAPKRSVMEQESMDYLKGRVVKSDVTSDDGAFTVKAGTVLDEGVLADAARYSEVLLALTMET